MVVEIKYQWLLEYQGLVDEIDMLKWRIAKSEIELERWHDPKDLGKVKLTNESNASHLEENIKRDKAFLAEKELAMEALMIMIGRFKGLDNQILRMKYLEGMTLKSISIELNYSYSYLMSRHAQLVRIIKKIEEVT